MVKYFLVIFIGLCLISEAQDKEEWISFETSVTGDFIKNFSGGINRDFTYIGLEELMLSFDIEALGLWKGGEIFLHGLNSHGKLPSSEITGDLQVFSNIEAGDYTGFYEFWIKQNFGKSSILIGQHDLNSEFVGTEYGGTFINSSFGISPILSLNIPVSIYPTASLALIYNYKVNQELDVDLGIYDGDPGDTESNRYNLQSNFSSKDGFLFIGELDMNREVNENPEHYKFGGYYHSGTFSSYSDTLESITGNYGLYFITDVVLYSGFNHMHKYIGFFLQGGATPGKFNMISNYLGGGFHFNGFLPQRYNDALGISFAWAKPGKPYSNLNQIGLQGEKTVELTYKISLFDYYTIQPNFQYIINPGMNSSLKNALVGLIRFNISL